MASGDFVVVLVITFSVFRTKLAMSGSVTFRESLSGSLDIIQPTWQQMKAFGALRPPADLLIPGVEYV